MLKRNGVLLNLGKHEFLISFQLGAEQLGTHQKIRVSPWSDLGTSQINDSSPRPLCSDRTSKAADKIKNQEGSSRRSPDVFQGDVGVFCGFAADDSLRRNSRLQVCDSTHDSGTSRFVERMCKGIVMFVIPGFLRGLHRVQNLHWRCIRESWLCHQVYLLVRLHPITRLDLTE